MMEGAPETVAFDGAAVTEISTEMDTVSVEQGRDSTLGAEQHQITTQAADREHVTAANLVR
jgi:hypothetical protein